jgi:hypothetical protein
MNHKSNSHAVVPRIIDPSLGASASLANANQTRRQMAVLRNMEGRCHCQRFTVPHDKAAARSILATLAGRNHKTIQSHDHSSMAPSDWTKP